MAFTQLSSKGDKYAYTTCVRVSNRIHTYIRKNPYKETRKSRTLSHRSQTVTRSRVLFRLSHVGDIPYTTHKRVLLIPYWRLCTDRHTSTYIGEGLV